MQDIVILISLISVIMTGISVAYYQEAIAQVIYNNADQCAADLSANPPRSPSGNPVLIQQQNLGMICSNLAGLPGSLADLTRSFTDCMNYLSSHGSLPADQKTLICNNLNPP